MWKKVLIGAMATMMMGVSAVPTMAAGSLKMDGSTSVYPLANDLVTQYNDAHKTDKISFSLKESDSGTGIKLAESGAVDIGDSSRDKKSTDAADLVFTKIAKDAVAVVVNANSSAVNLSKEDVADIFAGNITDWSQIPGSNKSGAIHVYTREDGSGTLDFFTSTFMGGTAIKAYATEDGNPAMHKAVAADPNGIGFVAMTYLDNQVTAYTINGVAPSVANVQNGTYIASRNFNMVTKGQPANNAKLFIDWILSPAGQADVLSDGEVPVTATHAVQSRQTQQLRQQRQHR